MIAANRAAQEAGLRRTRLALALLLAALLVVALTGPLLFPTLDKRRFTTFLFLRQDAAIAVLLALGAAALLRPMRAVATSAASAPGWLARIAAHPWLLALALVALGWIGHHGLLLGYDLTRDEQMADFDAAIFAHGRLFWPIAPGWRPLAEALNQYFILPVADRQAWVSTYLPVNAGLRALVGLGGDAGLTSPLLTAAGALALWRITLRLWPQDAAARGVTLLLYAGSSQVILLSMTAYAMAGHLALNLIWLALFLRNDARGHAGAILIGALATGLHQPLFHPLFVLPFLAALPLQRRWGLSALYAAAYLAIGLFWLAWPGMIASAAGGAMTGVAATGDHLAYADRLRAMLGDLGPVSLWLMAMNLLRFVAWQHLLLLPLATAGAVLCWRAPLVRPLVAGIVLHVVVVGILLAYQGHGWGYRYLHGVLGSACLLGGYGWQALAGVWPGRRLLAWSSAISLLILLPVHMAMAGSLTRPYARLSHAIDASGADIAIIDDRGIDFGADVVINRPDLSNRPIRLLGSELSPAQAGALCRHARVLFVDRTALQTVAMRIRGKPVGPGFVRPLQAACAGAATTLGTAALAR
jgi:hypothetical protein